jgi:hypothetical protein
MRIKIIVVLTFTLFLILYFNKLQKVDTNKVDYSCQVKEVRDRFGPYDTTVCGAKDSYGTVLITPHGQVPPYFEKILSTLQKQSRKVYFVDTGEKLLGNQDSQNRILNLLSSIEKPLCVISQSRGAIPVLNIIANESITKKFIGIYPVVDLTDWPDEQVYNDYISFIGTENSLTFRKTYNPLGKKNQILKNLESYFVIGGDLDHIHLQSRKLYSYNEFAYLNSRINLITLPGIKHEINSEIFENPILLNYLSDNC